MTSRINHGFHRIGIVLAALMSLLAVGVAVQEAMYSSPQHPADYTGALTSLGMAVFLYLAARAIGWVLAGFIG